MHARLVPGPRFGQSRPGICAPTITAGRYTNLGYSPTTCTTLPQRFSGRLPALQLLSSDILSDLTLVRLHITTHLDRLFRQRLAVHPPLWLEYWFDNISRFTVCREIKPRLSLNPMHLPADGNLHRVILGINEKTGLLKGGHDGHPGVEPFHTLQWRQSLPVQFISHNQP